jgi:hypothetical protein
MTWELALSLLLKYGPGFVAGIVDVIEQHPTPTKEALAKVLTLSQKSLADYLAEAQARAAAAQASFPPPTPPATPPPPPPPA